MPAQHEKNEGSKLKVILPIIQWLPGIGPFALPAAQSSAGIIRIVHAEKHLVASSTDYERAFLLGWDIYCVLILYSPAFSDLWKDTFSPDFGSYLGLSPTLRQAVLCLLWFSSIRISQRSTASLTTGNITLFLRQCSTAKQVV